MELKKLFNKFQLIYIILSVCGYICGFQLLFFGKDFNNITIKNELTLNQQIIFATSFISLVLVFIYFELRYMNKLQKTIEIIGIFIMLIFFIDRGLVFRTFWAKVFFFPVIVYTATIRYSFNLNICNFLNKLAPYILKFNQIFDNKSHLLRIIAFIITTIYIIYFSYISILKHHYFQSTAYDLLIFEQVLKNFATGLDSYSSVHQSFQLTQIHFSPGLYLFAPVYKLFPHTETLLIIQSFFLGLAGLILYFLAKSFYINDFNSLVILFLYLINPALHGVNLFDFHEIAFFPFFIFLSLLFLQKKNLLFFFLSYILAISFKEDLALFGVFFGGFLLINDFNKNRIIGSILLLSSISYFLLVTTYILDEIMIERFDYFIPETIDGYKGILITLLSNPYFFFDKGLFQVEKLNYILVILCSVGVFTLKSREGIIILTPALAVALLTNVPFQYSINFQYSANLLAATSISGIIGISNISSKSKKTTFVLITLSAVMMIYSISSIMDFGYKTEIVAAKSPIHDKIKNKINQLPNGASISTSTYIAPHLINKFDTIYSYPDLLNAEYIFNVKHGLYEMPNKTYQKAKEENFNLVNNGFYSLEYEDNDIYLLKRNVK